MKTCRPACPLIKGLFLTLCILFLFNSCQKEELFGLDPAVQPQASLLGESQVFLKNLTEERPLQATPKLSRHRTVKIPLWDKAQKVQLSIGEGLKVPLAYREEIKLLIGPNKEEAPLSDWTYLLLYKDRQQKWHAEVVTRIPDEQYWINRNRPGRSFSGIILVEDWWGRPIKTFSKTPGGEYLNWGNPVLISKSGERQSERPSFLNTPAEDCRFVVYTNRLGMYEIVMTCKESKNRQEGEGSGSGGGPDQRDYEEHRSGYLDHRNGGGGGGNGPGNDNPPPPDHINILRNQVQDPCLRILVDQVIRTNIDDMISGIISNLDEDIFVQIDIIDAPETTHFEAAETNLIKVPNSNIITGTITLSRNVLSNGTKEYAVTALTHEIIHAYLKYIGQNNVLQQLEHQNMVDKYINPMVNYLTNAFELSPRDATALSWIGVNDSQSYINTSYFDYPGGSISKTEVVDIYADYVGKRLGHLMCNYGGLE